MWGLIWVVVPCPTWGVLAVGDTNPLPQHLLANCTIHSTLACYQQPIICYQRLIIRYRQIIILYQRPIKLFQLPIICYRQPINSTNDQSYTTDSTSYSTNGLSETKSVSLDTSVLHSYVQFALCCTADCLCGIISSDWHETRKLLISSLIIPYKLSHAFFFC